MFSGDEKHDDNYDMFEDFYAGSSLPPLLIKASA